VVERAPQPRRADARGQPYAGYGGFTNFANPAVRRYQIAIAVAAARRGVDDILYDYVRRPDGDISTMAFPGLRETRRRRSSSLRESAPGAEAVRHLPRRLRLRDRGHPPRRGRAGHPGDGA
jgi:hypothetical protein